MEKPLISPDLCSMLLKSVFLLWDDQEGKPVIYHMVDPSDKKTKPCILLFSSPELLRKFKSGRYADQKRYPLMLLENKKAQEFLNEVTRLKMIALMAFEEENKFHLRQLTGAFIAATA